MKWRQLTIKAMWEVLIDHVPHPGQGLGCRRIFTFKRSAHSVFQRLWNAPCALNSCSSIWDERHNILKVTSSRGRRRLSSVLLDCYACTCKVNVQSKQSQNGITKLHFSAVLVQHWEEKITKRSSAWLLWMFSRQCTFGDARGQDDLPALATFLGQANNPILQ